MARPTSDHPTPAELEILKIIWDEGPCTVRQVMQRLEEDPPRAYTSVMSLLNVMAEKGMVRRRPRGRAFTYGAVVPRDRTLGRMVQDLLARAFEGSSSGLVAQLLDEARPTREELREIRKTIDACLREKGGGR
jgi:BlaI family transcriptional regulator, penicillinase repressor